MHDLPIRTHDLNSTSKGKEMPMLVTNEYSQQARVRIVKVLGKLQDVISIKNAW